MSSRMTMFIRYRRSEWSWRNFSYLLNVEWTPPFSEITSEPWLNSRADGRLLASFLALHPCPARSTRFRSLVASSAPPFHSVLAWWILNCGLVCFESQRIMCPRNAVGPVLVHRELQDPQAPWRWDLVQKEPLASLSCRGGFCILLNFLCPLWAVTCHSSFHSKQHPANVLHIAGVQ